MKSFQRFVFFVVLFVAASVFAADQPDLAVTVTAAEVVVRNVTVGGDVVVMTAQLEAMSGLLRQNTGAKRLGDSDRDGVVTVTPKRPIPLRSIWVVVDLETGRSAIAGPSDYPITILPFPEQLLKRDAEGVLGLFDNETISAELLIVRPKTGAWRLVATEGGSGDGDKEKNDKLGLASGDAIAVGSSDPAPKRLKKGDILAVIDRGRMEVFVTEIGQ